MRWNESWAKAWLRSEIGSRSQPSSVGTSIRKPASAVRDSTTARNPLGQILIVTAGFLLGLAIGARYLSTLPVQTLEANCTSDFLLRKN